MLWRALGHASLAVLRLGPAYRFEPITVPIRPIRFSESSFHRPEAAEKKFVSYIPFLIWVDLVSRLHAIRFTRLHETKLCLRLRACKQVCKVIVGLSNCMVMARGAAQPRQHPPPCHALNLATTQP
jgi:hypothetical protein